MFEDFSEKLLLNIEDEMQFYELTALWYQETQWPVFLTNSQFFKITSKALGQVADEIPWVRTYLFDGRLPVEAVDEFAREALESRQPILRFISDKTLSLLAAGVQVKDEKILAVVFVKTEQLKEAKLAFCEFLKAVSIVYRIAEHHLDSREVFLRDLLDRKTDNEDQIQARASLLGIHLQKDKPLCIMVGRLVEQNRDIRKELCRRITEDLFPGSFLLDRGTHIVVLVTDHHQVMRGTTNLLKAEKVFQKSGARFCICPPAHKFYVLMGQYREARDITEMLASRENVRAICFFELFVMEYILAGFSTQTLQNLCLPEVKEMYARDLQAGTEYTKVLYAYLLCYGNCAEIAELLGVSYNTAKTYIREFETLVQKSFRTKAQTLFFSIKILCLLYPSFESQCNEMENHLRDIKR